MNKGEPQILFAFSPELDTAFLQDLYGDDLHQAEMIFESSLNQLKAELPVAETKFHDGDLSGLKKIIHKLKPVFGYVGMNDLQERYREFEDGCGQAQSVAEIEPTFSQIIRISEQAIQKIEEELNRLKQFNIQFL
ncbi:MAG: hypothetical protein C5B52_06735 [Bacteroidetes bacterium]|nr:MAG: hypothetical protein C5B52_06735 [Bacteroidota bacterium]